MIVLISGDIDFVQKLSDLRHRLGYTTCVIHNALTRKELISIANYAVSWESLLSTNKNKQAKVNNNNAKQPKLAHQKQHTPKKQPQQQQKQAAEKNKKKAAASPVPAEQTTCPVCDKQF